MNQLNLTRDEQLQELNLTFSTLGKAISLRYGDLVVSGSVVLDKVLLIIGTEKTVNIKHLASLLMVTSGAATQHVAALEDSGAVKRVMSKQDRREIEVHLTAKGQRMYEEVQANSLYVLREIFAGLDETELTMLIFLITKSQK